MGLETAAVLGIASLTMAARTTTASFIQAGDQLRMARELGINDEASLKKYASEIQKSQRS